MTTEQLQRWLRLLISKEAYAVVHALAVAVATAERNAGVSEREAPIMLLGYLACSASAALKVDLPTVLCEVCEAAVAIEAHRQAEKLPC